MGKLTDWALDKIDRLPAIPAPFLLALIVIILILLPTIRRARTTKVDAPAVTPTEALPFVTLNAGGVYTVLIGIEVELRQLVTSMHRLNERVEMMEKMVRRRKRHPQEKKKAP